ncbi:MAG: deoxynucleoside kinase [Anaerolineales bacterium]|jgi:deoxyadenosine/deoxycytidine kinase
MGNLITIIGNNGSGKTTLTRALGNQPGFTACLESHADRPYQHLFSQDVFRYALPNQLDYLLRRAEQERAIREDSQTGVQDGGLDQDYYLYTQLFHHKGFLDECDFSLCRRTYHALRAGLPPPDLVVRLNAPLELLRQRLQVRARTLDLEQIVTLDDLPVLEKLLEDWLTEHPPLRLLEVDVSTENVDFSEAVAQILKIGADLDHRLE